MNNDKRSARQSDDEDKMFEFEWKEECCISRVAFKPHLENLSPLPYQCSLNNDELQEIKKILSTIEDCQSSRKTTRNACHTQQITSSC